MNLADRTGLTRRSSTSACRADSFNILRCLGESLLQAYSRTTRQRSIVSSILEENRETNPRSLLTVPMAAV